MNSPLLQPLRIVPAVIAVACSALAFLSACEGRVSSSSEKNSAEPSQITSAAPIRPRLIILISIDTLRADHLSLYGYPRMTSPNLDLFALEGASFEDASSVAPWTLPAHASMLTGLYPMTHGVIEPGRKLPKDIPTLAKLLGDHGWRTAAAVNSAWLLRKTHELSREFDDFLFVQEVLVQRFPTRKVTDRAMRWIEEAKTSNLFLFMHYYDVHSDYKSLPRFEKLFVAPYEGEIDGTTWQLNVASMPDSYIASCQADFDAERCRFGAGESLHYVDDSVRKPTFAPHDLRHLEELYDAGIRQIDDELGRFFRYLESEDLFDVATVIVTSDHGEELSDHGSFYHFLTIYQEVLRVPLIVRGAGIPPGQAIGAPVSIVDLAPTILAWAGIEPPAEFEGFDLGPLLRGEPDGREARALDGRLRNRFQHAEASGGLQWQKRAEGLVPIFSSIRRGKFKLVHQTGTDSAALYDLESDPKELIDISAKERRVAETLLAEMRQRQADFGEDSLPENRFELDPEEAERLRALGYIID